MMHVGDIMSTSGDVQYTGGYHDTYGEQVGENLSVSIENPNVLNIPQCTHDIPDVLMISPNVLMVSPDVLNIPQCTHDIPSHAS